MSRKWFTLDSSLDVHESEQVVFFGVNGCTSDERAILARSMCLFTANPIINLTPLQ